MVYLQVVKTDGLSSGSKNTYYLTPSLDFLYGMNSHHLETCISVLGATIPRLLIPIS